MHDYVHRLSWWWWIASNIKVSTCFAVLIKFRNMYMQGFFFFPFWSCILFQSAAAEQNETLFKNFPMSLYYNCIAYWFLFKTYKFTECAPIYMYQPTTPPLPNCTFILSIYKHTIDRWTHMVRLLYTHKHREKSVRMTHLQGIKVIFRGNIWSHRNGLPSPHFTVFLISFFSLKALIKCWSCVIVHDVHLTVQCVIRQG